MYQDYISVRDMAGVIGQPLMTYIFAVSILLAAVSVYYLASGKRFGLLVRLLKVQAVLLALGFLVLVWFHIQLYNSVDFIERLAVPLWIENEKLYFWALLLSFFTLHSFRKDNMVGASAALVLAVLSSIVYLYSNPFVEPLPKLHSEITGWYSALGSGDQMAIQQAGGQFYGRVVYYYNSEYMWLHPPMLFIAYASLVITFAACVFMLIGREKRFETIAYGYAKIGYLLLTAGMLLGYPWAVAAWSGTSWWWDPKINGSIMMWVLYSAYLHTRIYDRLWRLSAVLGIVCFLSLVFTYLLTYIAPGIHSVAQ